MRVRVRLHDLPAYVLTRVRKKPGLRLSDLAEEMTWNSVHRVVRTLEDTSLARVELVKNERRLYPANHPSPSPRKAKGGKRR